MASPKVFQVLAAGATLQSHSSAGRRAIRLIDEASGEDLGEVSEQDVEFLIDQLEEESGEDRAYYLNQDTVTLLRTNGASQELLALLERAINRTGEAEVRWTEA